MVIIGIILSAIVLGLLVSLMLYLEKVYKDSIYVDIYTKDRYKVVNRCTINISSKPINGVIYYKESEINPKYYVMNIEVFYSKYMKLSNYEEYARDIKSR